MLFWNLTSIAAPLANWPSLPIPSEHFACWLLGLDTCLPVDHSFNAVLICVHKLTKLIFLASCATREGDLSAKAIA